MPLQSFICWCVLCKVIKHMLKTLNMHLMALHLYCFRLVLGTLYPAYASYKAVKTKNVKEYVSLPAYRLLNFFMLVALVYFYRYCSLLCLYGIFFISWPQKLFSIFDIC